MKGRQELKLTLKMLTPIWTGGIDGTFNKISATGIIGSLRWWYEAIMRGLGKENICNSGSGSCILNAENFEKNKTLPLSERLRKSDVCEACQLFGATGWKRRFSLKVVNNPRIDSICTHTINIRPYTRNRGWYLPVGYSGPVEIELSGDETSLSKVLFLLKFLESFGGIGAKQQMGYGIFQITKSIPEIKIKYPFEDLISNTNPPLSDLPDLRTFTFFEFSFNPKNPRWWEKISGILELLPRYKEKLILDNLARNNMIPISPVIKNQLRFMQKWSSNLFPHWFFGKLFHEDRIRSKIGISWAYKETNNDEWKIRGWFYVPSDGAKYRNELVNVFRREIGESNSWLNVLMISDYHKASISLFPSNSPWDIQKSVDIDSFLKDLI